MSAMCPCEADPTKHGSCCVFARRRSLMRAPGGPAVARLFGHRLLGALGRPLLPRQDGGSNDQPAAVTAVGDAASATLPLLLDVCSAIRPEVRPKVDIGSTTHVIPECPV